MEQSQLVCQKTSLQFYTIIFIMRHVNLTPIKIEHLTNQPVLL